MLTLVELSGLLLVILVGVFAIAGGNADWSRVVAFDTPEDKSVFLAVTTATSLAFFAMVGFEDSVNMAEETKDPSRIFPKIMLTGLTITGIIYVLVAICRGGPGAGRSRWPRARPRWSRWSRPVRRASRSTTCCRSSRCSPSRTRR